MNARISTVLLVLLAVVSLATTALLTVSALNANPGDEGTPEQSRVNPLFAEGLELPEFSLLERSGRPFGSQQLRGRVWIADFIFTRCPGICPTMTAQMARLQREMAGHRRWSDLRLVSISVEPDHDTPEQLRKYAEVFQADPEQWLFLTGEREEIWDLCRNGFKQTVQENAQNSTIPIVHTPHFILVDRQRRIRGFYDSLQEPERERLRRDLERVLGESQESGVGT